MASNAPNKSLVARAAAILTTGEVAATRIDLNETYNSSVSVHLGFTIGSLTNMILRHYVSMDGTTYVPIESVGGAPSVSYTPTATNERVMVVHAPGWKYYRSTAQGTGTVTSSSATITYRYLRRGSQ